MAKPFIYRALLSTREATLNSHTTTNMLYTKSRLYFDTKSRLFIFNSKTFLLIIVQQGEAKMKDGKVH